LLEIVTPIEGQPADLAGLEPGDIIVAVDGESVAAKSFDEVLLMVRGPEGSTVNLTVEREEADEPLEFSIVRTEFEVPVTEARMLENDIAYVRLLEFNRTATSRLREEIDDLLAEDPQALIFDLRNNPGGFLNQSIAVADLFLPEGVVLYERNNGGLDETFTSDDGDLAETIPMVVLVNQASASASEIVAGALRDNERAVLIGGVTFGKGSVQQIHTLSDGSELRVTTARWYTPDDVSISPDGLTPDIEVEADPEVPLGDDADPQLQRAIDYLLSGE
jgi:carboxyl-terminal processing protease